LLDQRERLIERVRQTEAMIRAVDAALDALQDSRKEETMKMEDLFEGFDPSRYEGEVRHRWGTSEAFLESETRRPDVVSRRGDPRQCSTPSGLPLGVEVDCYKSRT
jgi:hypothetical protein